MIRAFVALQPPEPLRDRLEDLAHDLDEGRVVPWENLHLTLAFLGDARPETLEDVAAELDALREAAPAVELRGLGAFGGGKPRSVHALAKPTPELTHLRNAVRRACRAGGLELPHERFVPHVTLVRFSTRIPAGERLPRWLQKHAAFAAEPFSPAEAWLMRSDLAQDRPNYTELMPIPLLPPMEGAPLASTGLQ